ncbi:MAG: tetratricopeptide repeat protein [Chitinophagales bacterium]|nr:tetratricopeptide repeat protein [Chitinophagales bacterium]HAE14338.1 hypothetical protein [Bacteroidota bacterium]MCB9019821.1 tetratricopeptide repeat protein [Chitinophagales bacterium]MCB9022667.1 tetratricopeptide repeat protein [Chitinophagales bacterium]HAE35477.1 hypothetical protein [Bacteroidota bacterium]
MKFRLPIFLILFISVAIVSCNNADKQKERIADLQMEMDSVFASTRELTPSQKEKAHELIDAYLQYADQHQQDPNAAAYMFEAARLTTALPEYERAIEIFRLIVNKFPESEYAPRSLLSIGGIYDVSIGDYEQAKKAYEELNEKYPLQAEEYDVPAILRTLGMPADQILRQLRSANGTADSMDIRNGSASAE